MTCNVYRDTFRSLLTTHKPRTGSKLPSPYSLPVSTNSISCHRNCAQDIDRYCTFIPRKLANQIKYELLISDNILWCKTLHLPFQFLLSHFSPLAIVPVWTTNWYPKPRCSTAVPLLVLYLQQKFFSIPSVKTLRAS